MTPLLRLLGGGHDEALLSFADRTLCTPLLRDAPELPAGFARDVEGRIQKVAQRRRALVETYRDAAAALERAGVEFVLIKGFTHEADAGVDPSLRAQADIDLLCQPHDIKHAQNALIESGFVFHRGDELSDNHGRPLVKPHAWKWQGDYFDPAQPVPVEVHHSIWSQQRDRIPTPGTDAFWERREWVDVAGSRIPVFCDVDRLAVAALHLLRHVLRNNLRPGHAWELERMLRLRAGDDAFWDRWRHLHPPRLRALQVLAFRFACLWFDGELHPTARSDWDSQPATVHAWFQRHAFSPVANLSNPNKDVLWLHLTLLPGFLDRCVVARRRLLPLRVPRSQEASGSYASHIARRGRYHAIGLARALWRAAAGATARSKASHTSD